MYTVKYSVAFSNADKTFQQKDVSLRMVLRIRKNLLEKFGHSLLDFSVYDSKDNYCEILSYYPKEEEMENSDFYERYGW